MALGLGQAVNSFTRGAADGLSLVNAVQGMKNAKQDREQRLAEHNEDRQHELGNRQKADQALAVGEQIIRHRRGLPVDTDVLAQHGVQGDKLFSDQMGTWVQRAGEVGAGQRDPNDPDFVRAFNWRNDQFVKTNIGEPVAEPKQAEDGTNIPAGSKIIDKEALGFTPINGASGMYGVGLRVTAELPDGSKKTYRAMMTDGQSSDPTAGVMQLPLKKLIQQVQGDTLLYRASQDPNLEGEMQARYFALTGKEFPKEGVDDEVARVVNVREGENDVPYVVYKSGKRERMTQGGVNPQIYGARERTAASDRRTSAMRQSSKERTEAYKSRGGGSGGAGGASDTAMIRNIQYVAKIMYGGDEAKAAQFIKYGDPSQVARSLATTMFTSQQSDVRTSRRDKNPNWRSADQFYQDVLKTVLSEREHQADNGEDFSGAWGGGSGGASSAESAPPGDDGFDGTFDDIMAD